MELLSRLVDKSLVVFERDSGRYQMLDTIREYASDRLGETGEEDWAREQHMRHFLEVCESVDPLKSVGPERADWLARIDADRDNVRAALTLCLGADFESCCLRMCASLWMFWAVRGYLNEGLQACRQALEQSHGQPPELRARVLNGMAFIAMNQCDLDAMRRFADEALMLSRDTANENSTSFALIMLSGCQDDQERALCCANESLRLARQTGNRWLTSLSLHHLAALAAYRDDRESARALVEESLALCRENKDELDLACNLELLAEIDLADGQTDEARIGFEQALRRFAERSERRGIAMCLEGLAELDTHAEELDRAARLFSASQSLRNEIGADWSPYERALHDQTLQRLRTLLGTSAFQTAWEQGIDWKTQWRLAEASTGPGE